jgi:dihydrodipicolinate synthase/N-acetylneuraminate lyase
MAYAASELRGLNWMAPAFATADATSLEATNTVHVDNLAYALDKGIKDGIDVISMCGSFGEFHTLLFDEFQTLVKATLDVVNKRVPVFFGITSINGREAAQKAKFVRQAGGEGIFTGVPFYYPPTVENTINYFEEMSEMFSDLSIQIYHNPPLHRIHIPVRAFNEFVKHKNIVSMKDSHRSPLEFMKLMDVVQGKITQFVNQMMYHPYQSMGAGGFWSTDAAMGPAPLLYLRNVTDAGNYEESKQILREIAACSAGGDTFDGQAPQDNARKIASTLAGYCDLGPNRSPFMVITPESQEKQNARALKWKALQEKYASKVQKRELAAV